MRESCMYSFIVMHGIFGGAECLVLPDVEEQLRGYLGVRCQNELDLETREVNGFAIFCDHVGGHDERRRAGRRCQAKPVVIMPSGPRGMRAPYWYATRRDCRLPPRMFSQLLGVVDQATNPWGVQVTRIEIKHIQPPQDLIEAMVRQRKAEREKRAAILEAEGEKQAVILEVEGRKESTYREAEAAAKATHMVSQAIAKGDINAVNDFVAQRYVEALEKIGAAANQKRVSMPLGASAVIG